jgi:hypothetical protein
MSSRTTAALGIDDVVRPDVAARFHANGDRAPNIGFTKSALWTRFVVENATDAPLERWFAIDAPTVETIEVFRTGESRAVQGVLHPRSARELPRPGYTFRIALAPHERMTVHVRGSGFSEVLLPSELWEIGELLQHDRRQSEKFAVAYGVLLTMLLYNLFLFAFVRDRSHVYYALAILGASVWLSCLDGTLLDAMPAGVETISHSVNVVSALVFFLFELAFMRRALALPATYPRVDRAFVTYAAVFTVVPVLTLVGLVNYRVQNLCSTVLSTVTLLIMITLAIVRMRDGVAAAKYFVAGWVGFLFVVMFTILGVTGVFSSVIVPLNYGFAIESIFFSLALADATRRKDVAVARGEREVNQLDAELRHQVAERSRELGEALGAKSAIAASPIVVGERFHGRYRVIGPLGEGGMGVVYEVERLTDAQRFAQRFALKVITGAVSGSNAVRFAREAEIGARVRDANVVSIVDVGVERGAPFLVMALVRGRSLESMRDRFGDLAWAVPILRQIAHGLVALHEAGVVHRDLKPGNVLVGDDDIAKISDFGISRLGAESIDVQAATVDASSPRPDLTGTGAFLGTPLYMAPESAAGGRRATIASDWFAFGIIAYEMLAKRPPFAMPPVMLAMAKHDIPTPPPIAGVPDALAAIVLECLAVDPAKRPPGTRVIAALRSA